METMETMDDLLRQKALALSTLAVIDAKIRERKSQTLVRCDSDSNGRGCGAAHEVRNVEYIQTHWYEGPHGCSGGDFWHRGEGQWACPSCGHKNRLYNKPDVEALKPLFKQVTDSHER